MSPLKRSVDNKRITVNSVTRIPGAVGWGIERPHLRAKHNIITDDTRAEFPISKNHLAEIDFNRTMKFQKFEGSRA